jgi:hypothetical protein
MIGLNAAERRLAGGSQVDRVTGVMGPIIRVINDEGAIHRHGGAGSGPIIFAGRKERGRIGTAQLAVTDRAAGVRPRSHNSSFRGVVWPGCGGLVSNEITQYCPQRAHPVC